ncbi:MAG TPA: tetratricopeptide repeat protein [Anaerolineae bacterium]|nr:tetratricopeptide repeat protein [Anaerolineae bacterium]
MNLIRVLLLFLLGVALLLVAQPHDSIAAASVERSDEYRSTYAFNEADRFLQPALIRQPWNAMLYLRSSDIALGLRDLDRSSAQLDLADVAGADRSEVEVRRAILAEARQQFELAATFWLSATLDRPEDSTAILRLIDADVRLAKFDAAKTVAQDWLDRSNLPEAHFALAKLIALDDPISTKDHFTQAPVDQAQEFLAALNDPQSSDPAYRSVALGRAYLVDNDLQLAARAFQTATLFNPNYADAFAYYGFTLDQLGQAGGAQLDRAVEINRDLVVARYFRALHAIAQGDQSSALIDLKVAIDREPQNYLVAIELGRAYARQADFVSAEKWLQVARDLRPEDVLSWQVLCEFYSSTGANDQAIAAAQQAVVLAPNDAEAHVWLGRAHVLSGNFQFAEQELRTAVRLEPRSATAHYFLGRFLKRNTDEGRLEFERASALDPTGAIGDLARRELSLP